MNQPSKRLSVEIFKNISEHFATVEKTFSIFVLPSEAVTGWNPGRSANKKVNQNAVSRRGFRELAPEQVFQTAARLTAFFVSEKC